MGVKPTVDIAYFSGQMIGCQRTGIFECQENTENSFIDELSVWSLDVS